MLKNLIKIIAAMAMFFGVVNAPAYALYNDQTRVFNPRLFSEQEIHFYRFTVNYNDPNIGTAQKFGSLPANAYILSIDAHVTTAFNAGTTNYLSIGVTTSANELVAQTGANASVTMNSATVQHLTAAAGLGLAVTGNGTYTGSPVNLYVKYAQSGTAATAGSVTVVIAYIPNMDQ